MKLIDNSSQNFAIFVRSSYGDLLMIDPLIKLIKSLNKKNKITLFVDDNNSQLVEFMNNIDAFYEIPSKGNKYLAFLIYGLKHRNKKFDVSIAAKTGTGSANGFFPFFLGANKQISYVPNPKKWTDFLINCPVPFDEEIYHSQHYALGVLQLVDKSLTKIPSEFHPRLVNSSNFSKGEKLKLLISVSNNRKSCSLSIKSTAQIINSIVKKFDLDIYISSLEVDSDKALELQKKTVQHSTIKITPLLKDFIELIGSMDICFFGEGGSMHMAAALGVPQVVLFGNTSPVTWHPLSDNASTIHDASNVNNIPINKIILALQKTLESVRLKGKGH